MNRVVIISIVSFCIAACNKQDEDPELTYNEIMYQMALDTLSSITDLYAVQGINPDGTVSDFWWNSPFSYSCNPDGSPREGGSYDTTKVFPELDTLWIYYTVEMLVPRQGKNLYLIPIFYDDVDSFTSAKSCSGLPNSETFRVHWREDHDHYMYEIFSDVNGVR